MTLYSTNDTSISVNFETAIFKGLPDDNGLYMPHEIPTLTNEFFEKLPTLTLQEIALEVSNAFLGHEIPKAELKKICDEAINFPIPLNFIDTDLAVLELFHGPTLAFKDVGARFMAGIMGYFLQQKNQKITILVATSGDTGGAVASAFLGKENINVVILYPHGGVSPLQEKQLTTLGQNIRAYAVEGNFDDCQRMVKEAFLDAELKAKITLASANSINIARLIPQSFYYFWAYSQAVKNGYKQINFVVPSGNFGNITAGILAYKMGLKNITFTAATNANDTVPQYFKSGEYAPKASVSTISNAMDVGNPSNFIRMKTLFNSDFEALKSMVSSYSISDIDTNAAINAMYLKNKYILCPHTAVGVACVTKYCNTPSLNIVLGTAHPAKFIDVVEEVIQTKIALPQALNELVPKENVLKIIKATLDELKAVL